MPLYFVEGDQPQVDAAAFVAPGARLVGAVRLLEGASVWFNAVLRADNAEIVVGRFSNVQDNCVIHTDPGIGTFLGEQVTMGHGSIVHHSKIGDRSLIGNGAVVLDESDIGEECLIGAGAVVPPRSKVPPRSLVVGIPGRVVRQLTDEDVEKILLFSARDYQQRAQRYRRDLREV
ncbi:MAG: gamma carbonic anhydrase family protein [Chloroflexi bacterium]|nr:gamma carbonic anhydrase family protein [Chloroflexota bacterium]